MENIFFGYSGSSISRVFVMLNKLLQTPIGYVVYAIACRHVTIKDLLRDLIARNFYPK